VVLFQRGNIVSTGCDAVATIFWMIHVG